MTAATAQPTADQSGWPLSAGDPRRSRTGRQRGAPSARANGFDLPAATVTRVAESVPAAVPAPRPAARAAVISDGSATTSRAALVPLSPPVTSAPLGGARDSSGQGGPASASLVEDGTAADVLAYADGLDGSERKVLLNHIAQAWPEVVQVGVELVAQWRAECAERRRESEKRRRRGQRQRLRARTGETWPPRG